MHTEFTSSAYALTQYTDRQAARWQAITQATDRCLCRSAGRSVGRYTIITVIIWHGVVSSSASRAQHHPRGGSELKGLFQTLFSSYSHQSNNVMTTVLPALCLFVYFFFSLPSVRDHHVILSSIKYELLSLSHSFIHFVFFCFRSFNFYD